MDLILGRQGSGKTTEMFERIKTLGLNESIYIVVPDQFTLQTERSVFNALNVEAISQINVTSLSRLARKIVAEVSAESDIKLINKESRALIIKYIIENMASSLDVFGKVCGTKGFADEISSILSDIRKNDISSKTLGELSVDGNMQLTNKIKDISVLAQAYSEVLGEAYSDTEGYLDKSSRYISVSKLVKDSYFFFDDYYTFDRSDLAFLTELVKYAKNVTFTVLCDVNDKNFAVGNATVDDLRSLMPKTSDGTVMTLPAKLSSPDDIKYLEKGFFSLNAVPYARESSNVSIYEADELNEEVLWVASKIQRLVRDEGYRYRQISVAVPDTQKYSSAFHDIFTRAGIPFFDDTRRQIIFTSPVKALMFLTSFGDRVTTNDIIAFTKTGFTELTDEEIDLIDTYVLEFGIKGKMWMKPFRRNNREDDPFNRYYDLDRINAIRSNILKPIEQYKEITKYASTGAEFASAIYEFIKRSGFRDRIQQYQNDFIRKKDYESANIYAQIYNKIINIIDQLKNFLGNTPMNAKQLSDLITYAFSVSDVGIIPAAFDRVNVGSITRSRGEGIRAMFVLGANEGMLPQKVADGGILTNKDKDILNTKGVGFRDTYEYLRSRDMLSIYTVMTRPGEKLYVSRFKKESDVSDTEYYSSQLFEQIKKMFSLESEPFSMLDGITSVESAFDALALYHIKNEKDEFEEIYDSIYSFFRENPEYSRFADNADTAFGFTNDAVIRDTDTFAGVIDSTRALSITRLETYAACPFRYFVNYVLRPRKKAENKVNSLDTGTILHEIIQLYTDMILEGKVEPSTIEKEEIDSVIAILTDKVISGKKYEMLNCSDYVKNKIRLSASRAALVITIQFRNSDFLMEEAEAEFNFNKKMVPVCVDIPGEGQIFLQGKIDRIDSCEIDGKKYARIIDYKTSGKEFDITNVFYGLSLQLPVYINAYNENNADAKTAGIFYLRIDPNFRGINKKNELEEALSNAVNDEFKQNGLMLRDIKVKHALDHTSDSSSRSRYIKAEETDEEGFELLIKKTNENIASLYSRLRHADISINPSRVDNQREACGICDFKDICKFSEDFGANCYKDIRKLENRNIKEVFA